MAAWPSNERGIDDTIPREPGLDYARHAGGMGAPRVETHPLDVDEPLKIMDAAGIERTIVSLTSPGIQGITDAGQADDLQHGPPGHC